jgi:preprotein translocase subunit SecG
MAIFIGILTFIEVLVCLLLILFVLMQRPRQEGLGASFGEGMMSQIAGAQTTNVLQKLTVYLAVLLFILTLSLAVLTARQQTAKAGVKIYSEPPPAAAPAAKEEPKPAAPDAAKKEAAPAAAKKEAAPAAAKKEAAPAAKSEAAPAAKKEVAPADQPPAAAPKAAAEAPKPAAPTTPAPAAPAKEAAPKANP